MHTNMESKGVNNWDDVLYQASLSGHLEVVKYAESKGANNWNSALRGASLNGYLDIVKSYSA